MHECDLDFENSLDTLCYKKDSFKIVMETSTHGNYLIDSLVINKVVFKTKTSAHAL